MIKLRKQFLFSILSGVVFLALGATTPVTAQCNGQWDASGKWSFLQRNVKKPVELVMKQNGKAIFGSATLNTDKSPGFGGAFGEHKTGKVDGTILGDRFSIEIVWNGGPAGVYNARILPSGKLEGEGWAKNSPNVRHAWYSVGVLKCKPVR